MLRYLIVCCGLVLLPILTVSAQESKDDDKKIDVHSSVGDLHIGGDANARKAGLPLYPGSRPNSSDENGDKVNLGLLTEAFGIKLVVAKYDSDDEPAKVIAYYRDSFRNTARCSNAIRRSTTRTWTCRATTKIKGSRDR